MRAERIHTFRRELHVGCKANGLFSKKKKEKLYTEIIQVLENGRKKVVVKWEEDEGNNWQELKKQRNIREGKHE
jgi:hypothetical protein